MRRKDKEISDQNIISEILQNNTVCRLAFSENDSPYIVVMSYGFNNNRIYLHSAKEGRKIDIIKKNNNVCFEVTDSIEVIESEKACRFGAAYRSVIGFGKIFTVNETDKKIEALNIIMKQHSGNADWEYNSTVLDRVLILEIRIDSVTGKSSL